MHDILDKEFILVEAAIAERVRRDYLLDLHEALVHAPLVYTNEGRRVLKEIYTEYINVAEKIGVPILLATPTWRANRERVYLSKIEKSINTDAVKFLRGISSIYNTNIKIGGLIGCKNDCYLPNEGISAIEAKKFHSWQINQLSNSGADCLIAATLPTVEEALGIANAMSETDKPYIISFVIGKDGNVLDGSDLHESIRYIDSLVQRLPLGYFINCSYPSFLSPEKHDPSLFKRLIGFQSNGSSLEHSELNGSTELNAESVEAWGKQMLLLNKKYGIKMLGGFCGTNSRHLQYLAENQQTRTSF